MEPILKCPKCEKNFQNENDFLENSSLWRLCDQGTLWFRCHCGQTLSLQPGRFSWYSPERNLSPEAAKVFNKVIKLESIPHIKSVIFQLQKALEDPMSSADDIAKILRKEPLLASDLLKISNNLKRNDGQTINSISHAVSFLGRRMVSELSLGAAIKSFEIKCTVFNKEKFWQKAFVTGAIAEYLGKKHAKFFSEDQLFISGTMCNIGKILLALCFPVEADKIATKTLRATPTPLNTWLDIEKEHKIPQHTILGEIGAAIWGIPEYIGYCIRFHHTEDYSHFEEAKTFHELINIVALANQMAHWLFLEPHLIDHKFMENVAQKLQISAQSLETYIKEISSIIHLDEFLFS